MEDRFLGPTISNRHQPEAALMNHFSSQQGFSIPRWLAVVGLAILLVVAVSTVWVLLHPPQARVAQFGQIWQVYSFSPKVSATTYNSPSGGATIIWVSGMDNGEKPVNGGSS
jgi:hypothetical protein